MISHNGTTWTTKDETHEAYEHFQDKHGAKVCAPACQCGETTCYVVEPVVVLRELEAGVHYDLLCLDEADMPFACSWPPRLTGKVLETRFDRRGAATIINMCEMPVFLADFAPTPCGSASRGIYAKAKAYIPMLTCTKCDAKREGYMLAAAGPGALARALAAANKLPLTLAEKEDYKAILRNTFNKHHAPPETKEARKNKYLPAEH